MPNDTSAYGKAHAMMYQGGLKPVSHPVAPSPRPAVVHLRWAVGIPTVRAATQSSSGDARATGRRAARIPTIRAALRPTHANRAGDNVDVAEASLIEAEKT